MAPLVMTTPTPVQARRAAFLRSLVALVLVLLGVTTATLGAFAAWGLAYGLLFLGGCLFVMGIFVAVVG